MSMAEPFLLPPLALRPTEETIRGRIGEVIGLILDEQAWTQPIRVERGTLAVLDGHHRLAAAIQLGLVRVPVRTYDYATVPLTSWRPQMHPTRDEVLRRALTGRLYPPKTTRHTFAPEPLATVALARLLCGPGLDSISCDEVLPGTSGVAPSCSVPADRSRAGAAGSLSRHLSRLVIGTGKPGGQKLCQ